MKYLVILLVLFQSVSAFADEFSDGLKAIRTEAQAQMNYFNGLAEDAEKINESTDIVQLILATSKSAVAVDAIYQTYVFWKIVDLTVSELELNYSKFPSTQSGVTPAFQMPSIQKALYFLLRQINQAGRIAYNDIPNFVMTLGLSEQRNPNFETLIDRMKEIRRLMDDELNTHPHMALDIEEFGEIYGAVYREHELGWYYFTELKGYHSLFHFIKKFYVLNKNLPPTSARVMEKGMWVSLVHSRTGDYEYSKQARRVLSKAEAHDPGASDPTIQEAATWMSQVYLEDLNKEVTESIIKAKKAKKNKKKRENRAKKAKNVGLVEGAVDETSSSTLQSSSLEERKEKEGKAEEELSQSATSEAVSSPHLDSKAEGVSEEAILQDQDPDLESLLREAEESIAHQKSLSAAKKAGLQSEASSSSATPAIASIKKITLTGGAAKIYKAAMGIGIAQLSTNGDLTDFLNQVGGKFVQLAPKADPKIALPNYSVNATQPFWYDRMHLMHNGTDTFPIKRLQIHLRRMIRESGLDQLITF